MLQMTSTKDIRPFQLAYLAPCVQEWRVCKVISVCTIGELTESTFVVAYRARITTLAKLTLVANSQGSYAWRKACYDANIEVPLWALSQPPCMHGLGLDLLNLLKEGW